jgi:hypothetical protein
VRCWACSDENLKNILQKVCVGIIIVGGLGVPLFFLDLIKKNKPDERIAFDETGSKVTDRWQKQQLYMDALKEDLSPYNFFYKDVELKWAYLRIFKLFMKLALCCAVFLLKPIPTYVATCGIFIINAFFNLYSSPFLADLSDHLENVANVTHMITLLGAAASGYVTESKTVGYLMQFALALSTLWQFYKVWPYFKIWLAQKRGTLFFPNVSLLTSPEYQYPMEVKERLWVQAWDTIIAKEANKELSHRFDDISDQVKLFGRETFIKPVRWAAHNYGTIQYLLDHLEGNDCYYNTPATKDAPFGMLETKRFPFGATFISDAGVRVEFSTRELQTNQSLPFDLVTANKHTDAVYFARLQRRLGLRALSKKNNQAQVAFHMVRTKTPSLDVLQCSDNLVYDRAPFERTTVTWAEEQVHTCKYIAKVYQKQSETDPRPAGPVWKTKTFTIVCNFTETEWRPRSGAQTVDEIDIEGGTVQQIALRHPPTDYGRTTNGAANNTSCVWEQTGSNAVGGKFNHVCF